MENTIIRVDNLKKSYNQQLVVKGISFEVNKGELWGLLGANGAGKTTTLEIIETLGKKDGGKVIINGMDLDEPRNAAKIKRIIGVQLQYAGYYPGLCLKDLIEFYAAMYNTNVDADSLLKSMNLSDKKKSKYADLSGGQKQSFSILIAMINDPEILFLDEPTTGLDPHARRNLWALIKNLKNKGKTIILTTHYMEEAEELCDRVAIMKKGEILTIDSPLNMINSLVASGFKSAHTKPSATMEDVFINLTGEKIED